MSRLTRILTTRRPGPRRGVVALAVLAALATSGTAAATASTDGTHDDATAAATSYARISGEGSSWAGNALLQWQADVKAQGMTVDYTPDGSSTGRKVFAQGLTDFAVSEIPYTGDTADPQDNVRPNFDYSQLPVVAGGTAFMYNLPVNGQRFEALNLTQSALAGIFSGQITRWNDPAIAASNPGVNLPAQQITVVVRSDGSGSTAQFTLWMLRQFPDAWRALCARTGCNPSAATSYFPYQGLPNFTAQSGSNGVTTYTTNTPYSINYDEYSYALGVGYPVAGIQNEAGYYLAPTANAVAVALTQATVDTTPGDNYLSQDLSAVYEYGDPRTYPISSYSYMFVPAETTARFDAAKGAALAHFATYAVCQGQQSSASLGYSPLPMNLVLDAMDQILRIPGIDQQTQDLIARTKAGVASGSGDICDNPTFKPGDDPHHNVLLDTAPFPAGCDAACRAPWQTDSLVSVRPRVETPSAFDDDAGGDADADDPAIWVDRQAPGRSRVITTLKDAGLAVYDLHGRLVQRIQAPPAPGPDDEPGRFNNVDIVRGVMMAGRPVDLAVTSDRGRDQIRTYLIDRSTGRLSDVTAPDVPFAFSRDQAGVDTQRTIYGLDAYRAPDGAAYVVGTRRHTTLIGLFRLVMTSNGVTYRRVDSLAFPDTFRLPDGTSWSPCEDPGEGPQLEGLVVAPGGRRLFAAQEDVGLWQVQLGDGGSFAGFPRNVERTQEFGVPATYDRDSEECVASGPDPGFGGRIAADVEGLAIHATGGGDGTLMASSQGDSTFYTYDLRTLAPLTHFRVAATSGIDGSQDSDGADTVSTPLPGFPNGLLVVQDGDNTPDVAGPDGETRPNTDFKYLDAGILTRR